MSFLQLNHTPVQMHYPRFGNTGYSSEIQGFGGDQTEIAASNYRGLYNQNPEYKKFQKKMQNEVV